MCSKIEIFFFAYFNFLEALEFRRGLKFISRLLLSLSKREFTLSFQIVAFKFLVWRNKTTLLFTRPEFTNLNESRVIMFVFLQTRKCASWLAEKMHRRGHSVALLSGDLTVDQRAAVIERFRKGVEKVLISTNVTARG